MSFVRNLKIRSLLLSSFSIVSLLLVVVGTMGYMQLRQALEKNEEMYRVSTMPLADLGKLTESLQQISVALRDRVYATDAEEARFFEARLDALAREIDEVREEFAASIVDDEVQAAYDAFVASGSAYIASRARIMEYLAVGQTTRARTELRTNAFEAAQVEQTAIDRLGEIKIQKAQALSEESQRQGRIAGLITFGGVALGLLVSLGMGWLISGMVSRPVNALKEAANGIAQGNLDVTAEIDYKNELGELGDHFNEMVSQIQQSQRELEAEKAAIQDRVHQAVAESEAEQAYLSRSVSTMIQSMERFAAGDLSVRLTAERPDDIQRLYEGFNDVVR
ncbi:MAG: MCP four helix bundle domain-containing protein, partial [Bacteroidota bacterium]